MISVVSSTLSCCPHLSVASSAKKRGTLQHSQGFLLLLLHSWVGSRSRCWSGSGFRLGGCCGVGAGMGSGVDSSVDSGNSSGVGAGIGSGLGASKHWTWSGSRACVGSRVGAGIRFSVPHMSWLSIWSTLLRIQWILSSSTLRTSVAPLSLLEISSLWAAKWEFCPCVLWEHQWQSWIHWKYLACGCQTKG